MPSLDNILTKNIRKVGVNSFPQKIPSFIFSYLISFQKSLYYCNNESTVTSFDTEYLLFEITTEAEHCAVRLMLCSNFYSPKKFPFFIVQSLWSSCACGSLRAVHFNSSWLTRYMYLSLWLTFGTSSCFKQGKLIIISYLIVYFIIAIISELRHWFNRLVSLSATQSLPQSVSQSIS